jgi:hypothetical protein
MTTKIEATKLVERALNEGHVLTIPCPNGDVLTVGRASGHPAHMFEAIRWGRSRWALPSGLTVDRDISRLLSHVVVEHCGRGNAAKAARVKLS